MCKKIIPFMFILLFVLISSVNAKTIIWVTETQDMDGDGVNDSKVWADKIAAEGYTVDFQPANWNDFTDAKLAIMNQADLVIVSCTTQSGNYSNTGEVARWNSVTAPMILCSPYIARNSTAGRWQWINYGEGTLPNNNGDDGHPVMKVTMPSHSIFKGITLDASNQLKFLDPNIGSGHATFLATNSPGNGTLIAKTVPTSLVQDWSWIIEWNKGTTFYSGSSYTATEHRMYFTGIGYHEATDFPMRGYNLTDQGWGLFLNAIRYMLGEKIEPGMARSPSPLNDAIDLFNNQTLSWKPGVDAEKHYVFLGTDFNDVNNATIEEPLSTIFSDELDVNNFDPGLLDLESTYYWRVDEVLSSSAVIKGKIWKFTVEDAALKMLPASIVKVTAISSAAGNDPNNTVNGSGLDPNFPDRHAFSSGSNSWVTTGKDTNNVWIQYDFDNLYKIHQMLVWNYNHNLLYRYGFKDVLVQYSIDGQTWVDVPDANYFNKALNISTYEYNTTVDFNDVVAKSVRITAFSNHRDSNAYKAYGLSEVRFTYIPVWPRNLSPVDDSTNVDFDTKLKWRRGREALIHNLYIDTNEVNVTNRTITPVPLEVSGYSPVLCLGKTYYWRVDEVNTDMIPSVWESGVLSFSTPSNILIDGFETGYGNDTSTNAVFKIWKDGAELNESSNGSWMGRKSEPFLHTINHSNGHSAPMFFENKSYSYSEVIADTSKLQNDNDSDWSIGLPSTLTIWFRGDPNTTEVGDMELYCKIGGKTIVYGGSLDVLMTDMWRQFDINLKTLGVDLSNIPTITIGIRNVGSNGTEGVIYLDDIMLTGAEPVVAYPEILVQAEDYAAIKAPMEVNDVITGALGGKCVQVKSNTTVVDLNEPPTDSYVTYDIDLDGGQYVIWGRVTIANANADSLWVTIDGATANQELDDSGWCKWNSITAGTNWHWDDVHNADNSNTTVIWTIPACKATIRITYRETGANPVKLDALMVQKVGN